MRLGRWGRWCTPILGCVCKGLEPDQDSTDVEHGEIVDGALLIARGNPPKLLQAGEQALHAIARAIGRAVKAGPAALVALARDHRADAAPAHMLARRLARKRLV